MEDDPDLVREEAKEEEYDYFLDAHKDENKFDNQGYHLIDAADLEMSDGSGTTGDEKGRASNKQDIVDDDDLEAIQDEEVRAYRYQNMLEDLKDSI